jgi:outer membrane receptor for ferrienterochelin and colicins
MPCCSDHDGRPVIPWRPLLLAALAAAVGGRAAAGELPSLASLLNEPVVSSASRAAETAALAPASTSIVTRDDLRRHGIDSLHDAINFLALGLVTEASWATVEIGARGVLLSGDYGSHVLLQLDGHALNEPWDATAYYDQTAAIPLDLVDHIEVILGPGSVLYGSNAMLGVINVVTRRAGDYRGLHASATGSLPAAGHLALGAGLPLAPGEDDGLVLGLDWYRSQGPRKRYPVMEYGGERWGGEASHQELDVPAAYARFTMGELDLRARAASSRRAATLILGNFDDPRNYERDRWLSLDARWSAALTPTLRLSVRGYGDAYDYLSYTPWTASVDCVEGQDRCAYRGLSVSRWYGGEATLRWDWLADGRFVTLAGVEARRLAIYSKVDYRDLDTGQDERTGDYRKSEVETAAYLQQTASLSRWLRLNAGARLDYDPDLGGHLSPRVAVVSPAWAGGTVKAIYSEAFRTPNYYERFYSDPTMDLAAGNGLRPEIVRSLEAVVEQRIGAQRLRLGAFRTWWRDLIQSVRASDEQVAQAIADGLLVPDATDVYTYANASQVDSWGLNADWDGTSLGQRLRYGASITAARSRQQVDGGEEQLSAAGQLFGNAHVSWEPGGAFPTVGLALRAIGRRPVADTTYDPRPTARPQGELRASVSGPIRAGFCYLAVVNWALTDRTAYAIGPTRDPANGLGDQPVLRTPAFKATLGLRYDR